MSQEGYEKLVAELRRLESIERPKASAAIADARDKGDLSENSEGCLLFHVLPPSIDSNSGYPPINK